MTMVKLVAQLLVLLLSSAYAIELAADGKGKGSQTLDLTHEFSGWWNWSEAADVDDDMQGGGHNDFAGTGSAGRFTGGGSSDLAPWDGIGFCDFDMDGNPIAVPLYYVSGSTILRYSNGDLLYSQITSSPPSVLCFNFIDNTFTFETHADVVGGTGRFEGASGEVHSTGAGFDFTDGFGSLYGTSEGVIHGVNPHRRGNSDKDD